MTDKYQKVREWEIFSAQVSAHISSYTMSQYGNPDGEPEPIDSFDFMTCISHIERYCKRAGRNARGPKEQLRDLLKIAHYAQEAYRKYHEFHQEPHIYPSMFTPETKGE